MFVVGGESLDLLLLSSALVLEEDELGLDASGSLLGLLSETLLILEQSLPVGQPVLQSGDHLVALSSLEFAVTHAERHDGQRSRNNEGAEESRATHWSTVRRSLALSAARCSPSTTTGVLRVINDR